MITFSQEGPSQAESEIPKPWNVQDPFQFAPRKIDGDPWARLLEPLLKQDRLRCESWKDEVQNLLIFVSLSTS